jgi:hypothetical protein
VQLHCFAKGTLLKFSMIEVMGTEIFFENKMTCGMSYQPRMHHRCILGNGGVSNAQYILFQQN